MSTHSPTILEVYFMYSPPSFSLDYLLPGITLTLDPDPVLNPSEENFCIFPATVSQLPAPGTLFSASPPAKAGKLSLPRTLHVCTTFHPLLLLLLLLSHISRVRLFATPWTVALPGSSVHGISQARVLEWTAIAFSTSCYSGL